jgi:hypothetical protein
VVSSRLVAHHQAGLGTSIAQLYNRIMAQAKTLGRVANGRCGRSRRARDL